MGKLKKNGFIEGTMIAYICIVITKILGAFYSIPFYAIIGETGGFIYSCAYSVYNLVLNASTSGIPTSISIIISEYNARGMYKAKEKAYKVGLRVVFAIAFTLFLLLQIFAEQIGAFYMDDMTEGSSVSEIAWAIRFMAVCLLFAPALSVKRGYFQGQKFIAPSSVSQVVEQIVRIGFVLASAYLAVNILDLGESVGVNFAMTGAAVGALCALIYLQVKATKNRSVLLDRPDPREKEIPTKVIIKKILSFSIPVVIVSVSNNLYEVIDMKFVIMGLGWIGGYTDVQIQTISSIVVNWAPKICMLILALSMGMTASVVPNMTDSYVKKDYKAVNRKFNLAVNTILVISVPIALGLIILSKPVYTMFYGQSDFGWLILKFAAIVAVISSIKTVLCMCLQSMGKALLVCSAVIAGILTNTAFDLPLMYLCSFLGAPPYIGVFFSSMLGVSVCLTIVFVSMKKMMKLKYSPIVAMMIRVALPAAAMSVFIVLLQLIFPIPETGRLLITVYLVIYALLGGLVYGLLALKTGALQAVFGKETIDKILVKLHLKKLRS